MANIIRQSRWPLAAKKLDTALGAHEEDRKAVVAKRMHVNEDPLQKTMNFQIKYNVGKRFTFKYIYF